MNKQIIVTALKGVVETAKKKSPSILIGASVVGFAITAITAYHAAPKVNIVLQDAEEEKGKDLTKFEKVKEVTKVMWPTFAIGLLSAVCAFASHHISSGRIDTISAAVAVSEKALTDYQAEMLKEVGSDKAKEIKKNFGIRKAEENGKNVTPVDINSQCVKRNDSYRVIDLQTGLTFYSTVLELQKAEIEMQKRFNAGDYITINDLYDIFSETSGCKIRKPEIGENLRWMQGETDIFSMDVGALVDDDGTPCLTIDYDVWPDWTRK